MDVKVGNTYDYALNDVFKFIGLDPISKDLVDNIDKNIDESRVELYRCLVALILGVNFRENRHIIDPIITDYLKPNVDESLDELHTRTDCTLLESINTYIYLCLEFHAYSRLDKITLDYEQDPRELFLAIAFLVSSDRWFEFSDKHSEELKKLKEIIIEFASKDLDILNITNNDLNISEPGSNKPTKLNADIKNDTKTNREKLFTDYLKEGKKGEQIEYLNDLIEKKEEFEQYIVQLASDIKLKATLLSRRKTVRSYDSELLRLIMGRSDYENDFLRRIDDISSNQTDFRKQIFDKKLYTQEFSEEVKDVEEWEKLIREIVNLSNLIVQLQFKLRDLSYSIENNDLERLKYFSKITEEFKNYEKKNDTMGNEEFISDRYKQPSPVEFLLISDEHLFRRHMSIMKMINKSLDNEIRRKNFWIKAHDILKEIEGEENLALGDQSVEFQSTNNLLTIYSKPSDIKYNVHVLKSFLVEGIPTENFSVKPSRNDMPYHKSSMDFLRQVNVKFANFKAGQVSDKHGRKTTFSMFIINEIEKAKRKGFYSNEEHDKINETLKSYFHLYEDVDVDKTRIQFPLMSKWIDGTENFETITKRSGSKLNETIVNSISDTKTIEYEQLDKINFRLIDKMVDGKVDKIKIEPVPRNKSRSIADIIDYNYYFDLCKENYEITKETEVNCFGFSNEIDNMILDATENTKKNIEKSKSSIDQISKVIEDNTKLYVIY